MVLGTRTGQSFLRIKTEVHFGSYFGTLLPQSKNGNRDRRERFRTWMHFATIPKKTATSGSIPLSEIKRRRTKLRNP